MLESLITSKTRLRLLIKFFINIANKGYLKGFGEGKNLKTNLPLILHQADMMATRLEKERYMFSKDSDINYSEILNPELKEEREEQEKESVNNIKEAITKNL